MFGCQFENSPNAVTESPLPLGIIRSIRRTAVLVERGVGRDADTHVEVAIGDQRGLDRVDRGPGARVDARQADGTGLDVVGRVVSIGRRPSIRTDFGDDVVQQITSDPINNCLPTRLDPDIL